MDNSQANTDRIWLGLMIIYINENWKNKLSNTLLLKLTNLFTYDNNQYIKYNNNNNNDRDIFVVSGDLLFKLN